MEMNDDMKVGKTFAERFKKALFLRGMSQQDVADLTYINRSNISHYATGKRVPKSTNLFQIAKALNVSESWLLGYDVEMDRKISNITDFTITNGVEQLLIEKFRDADDVMKDMVIRMLSYTDKVKKGYEFGSNNMRGDKDEN